jgi:hypothetical protein
MLKVKAWLKTILKPSWIGVLAGVYSNLYRKTSLTFFYKRYPLEKIHTIHYAAVKPISHNSGWIEQTLKTLPASFQSAFHEFMDVEQQEYVRCVKNCFIEPKYGWPVSLSNELIFDCFPYSSQNIVPVPPLSWRRNKKTRHVDRVISFREIFDFGYWHFYADILHKNYLLEKYSMDLTIPIVVSKQLAEQPYFRYFYNNTAAFKGRELIIQGDFLLFANEAYFVKPQLHDPGYYKRSNALAVGGKVNVQKSRKIFLTRDPSRGRYLTNTEAVTARLHRHGFDAVDADQLTIEQQISLFSDTRFLVGIHGAGLSNIIFRYPGTLSLIEIFPFSPRRFQIPPHYFLIAGTFNFDYQAIMGSGYKSAIDKSFSVNVDELEKSVIQALEKAGF